MKKLISLVLALAMMAALVTCPVYASSENYKTNGQVTRTPYYYDEDYFAGNASVYNPSLATMSYCLTEASNAVGADNWTYQYRNLFSLFSKLGFVNSEVNEDYKNYPGLDTMGVGMAYKTTTINGKECTIIAIVPRSCNYEGEWASNFTVGLTGDASGFSSGANKVLEFAQYYVNKYGANFKGEIKLWIAGYSRGAAVANLTAGRITKAGKIGNYSVTKDNIYAYTFETPSGLSTDTMSVAEAKSYTNIHNIISSDDLVTKVAPQELGFIRYGTDESVIPEKRTAANNALYEKALSYLPEFLSAYTNDGKKIFGTETFQAKRLSQDISVLASLGTWTKENGIYKWTAVDEETAKELLIVNSGKTQRQVLDNLITAFSKALGTRANYVNGIESSLRIIISEYLGGGYQTRSWELAKETLKAQLTEYKESIIIAALTGKESVLNNILTNIATETIKASGFDIASYADLPINIAAVVPLVSRAIIADVVIDGGSDILSLIENLDIIFNPHYTEQCSAWLLAQDPNYEGSLKAVDARVKDVKVNVEKVVTTKKVLFVKITTTKYNVVIKPVSDVAVSKVEYRTIKLGLLTKGTAFTRDTNLSYLYMKITDANGNITNWEYKNGTVTQLK